MGEAFRARESVSRPIDIKGPYSNGSYLQFFCSVQLCLQLLLVFNSEWICLLQNFCIVWTQ